MHTELVRELPGRGVKRKITRAGKSAAPPPGKGELSVGEKSERGGDRTG